MIQKNVEKIARYIRMYGFLNTINRIIKSVIRKITGITYEDVYVLSRKANILNYNIPQDVIIKELKLSDLQNDDWRREFLSKEKYDDYIRRFSNNSIKGYGLFKSGQLASIGWILRGKIIYRGDVILYSGMVSMLYDQYTLKKFRGGQFHQLLIKHCINDIYNFNKIYATNHTVYVLVLDYNKPSLKNQIRCGFTVEKKLRFKHYKNKSWTVISNK